MIVCHFHNSPDSKIKTDRYRVERRNVPRPFECVIAGVALRAPQGFAPTSVREMTHRGVGPNETIKRVQIRLTEPSMKLATKLSLLREDH